MNEKEFHRAKWGINVFIVPFLPALHTFYFEGIQFFIHLYF